MLSDHIAPLCLGDALSCFDGTPGMNSFSTPYLGLLGFFGCMSEPKRIVCLSYPPFTTSRRTQITPDTWFLLCQIMKPVWLILCSVVLDYESSHTLVQDGQRTDHTLVSSCAQKCMIGMPHHPACTDMVENIGPCVQLSMPSPSSIPRATTSGPRSTPLTPITAVVFLTSKQNEQVRSSGRVFIRVCQREHLCEGGLAKNLCLSYKRDLCLPCHVP
jgi:hypothetical protein